MGTRDIRCRAKAMLALDGLSPRPPFPANTRREPLRPPGPMLVSVVNIGPRRRSSQFSTSPVSIPAACQQSTWFATRFNDEHRTGSQPSPPILSCSSQLPLIARTKRPSANWSAPEDARPQHRFVPDHGTPDIELHIVHARNRRVSPLFVQVVRIIRSMRQAGSGQSRWISKRSECCTLWFPSTANRNANARALEWASCGIPLTNRSYACPQKGDSECPHAPSRDFCVAPYSFHPTQRTLSHRTRSPKLRR
jgi:hypothetical protein